MVRTSDDPAFDQFWAAYPRRTVKADARKAWQRIAPDAELLAAILEALAWQRTQPQWLKDDGLYIPYPATWLRGERWTDEPLVVVKAHETWKPTPFVRRAS